MSRSGTSIIKASGEMELFSPEKLSQSLMRSGAESDAVARVMRRMLQSIRTGVTTDEIYKRAHALLRREALEFADRYKLKRAIMELGPSGFPFERFVAALLRHAGYQCTLNNVIQGKCVSHEVDVIASGSKDSAWIECKFHNRQGTKSDVKVTLYCYARYLDLHAGPGSDLGRSFWVVTNTKFTSDAICYANCMGMKLVGWGYPPENSIQKLIEQSGLYPITCLTTLKSEHKKKLLELGAALTTDLSDNPEILGRSGLTQQQSLDTLREVKAVERLVMERKR